MDVMRDEKVVIKSKKLASSIDRNGLVDLNGCHWNLFPFLADVIRYDTFPSVPIMLYVKDVDAIRSNYSRYRSSLVALSYNLHMRVELGFVCQTNTRRTSIL